MGRITVEARDGNLGNVLEFLRRQFPDGAGQTTAARMVELAAEEIFVNIAHYAYAPGSGDVTIHCEIQGDPPRISLAFSDSGQPFNPLAQAEPDVTLPAESRKIGGLGILLVKQVMDGAHYEYRDGQNCFSIWKGL